MERNRHRKAGRERRAVMSERGREEEGRGERKKGSHTAGSCSQNFIRITSRSGERKGRKEVPAEIVTFRTREN